jgi:hypothetical protein
MQVPEHTEERFLVHVPGVFRGAQQVHGEPKHTLVIGADQLLEGILVSALGGPD